MNAGDAWAGAIFVIVIVGGATVTLWPKWRRWYFEHPPTPLIIAAAAKNVGIALLVIGFWWPIMKSLEAKALTPWLLITLAVVGFAASGAPWKIASTAERFLGEPLPKRDDPQ